MIIKCWNIIIKYKLYVTKIYIMEYLIQFY
jgi:hypothetical protein